MSDYDCLYLCTDNRARSRYGLETLHKQGYKLLCVICLPKWKKFFWEAYEYEHWYNRKYIRSISSSVYCHENSIPYFATYEISLDPLLPVFEAHHFKYIISNSWPTKLPATFFKLAGIEAMNVHSSCLPYYRGGNRTYAPLINKEKFSGVTLHTLNDELDAGAIIKRIKFPIDKHETPKSLVRKGATYINDLLLEGLKIAGQKDNYLPNPPSPMYYSCGYAVYLKFKAVNFFRSLCKLPTLKLTPGKRHKFFDKI